MTDIKTLALKYGGYTSLDKVYLDQLLAGKTEQEQLALITPPPSVVNAYFAEMRAYGVWVGVKSSTKSALL